MRTLKLFYATNRNHEGDSQWRPTGYGRKFSDSGIENLRFGRLSIEASQNEINKHLRRIAHNDHGDGEGLSEYLSKKAENASIRAYAENMKKDRGETADSQTTIKLGSKAMFAELQKVMMKSSDVLIYVHGFNVSWCEAVGSALALQEMLNRTDGQHEFKKTTVVLFSWPSDGMALPYVSYKSDRTEAQGSGFSIGRGFLKVRDFLVSLADRPGGVVDPDKLCGQDIHLLCHSMGNYVLQSALARIREMNSGQGVPRLFEHIFMCAPDVDDDVLEPDKEMGDLHRLSRHVTAYHNKGDVAMYISDYTKSNPDRLGSNGAARPSQLHNKIHQVDCGQLVKGLVEHSYYLWGPVNSDIRLSISGEKQDSPARTRVSVNSHDNVWALV